MSRFTKSLHAIGAPRSLPIRRTSRGVVWTIGTDFGEVLASGVAKNKAEASRCCRERLAELKSEHRVKIAEAAASEPTRAHGDGFRRTAGMIFP
jgi:hypothetical protein